MTFTSVPENWAPAFADATYAFESDTEEAVEITVRDMRSGGQLGVKRLYPTQGHSVNIAGYLGRCFDMQPLTTRGGGVWSAPGRTAKAGVEAGGTAAPTVAYTASCGRVPARGMMSAIRRTTIRPGEYDEIPVLIPGENIEARAVLRGRGEREIPIGSLAAGEEAAVAVVSMPQIAASLFSMFGEKLEIYRDMRVEVRGNGTLAASRTYMLEHDAGGGMRLAWVNDLGGLDFCTFPIVQSRSVAASKQRIFTPEGYRTVMSRREHIMLLSSGYQPEERMAWIAGAVSSPRVWRCDAEGRSDEVDIVTDSAVESCAGLSSLTLAVRTARPDAARLLS